MNGQLWCDSQQLLSGFGEHHLILLFLGLIPADAPHLTGEEIRVAFGPRQTAPSAKSDAVQPKILFFHRIQLFILWLLQRRNEAEPLCERAGMKKIKAYYTNTLAVFIVN